jgi:protein required for attachment to host cells
LNHDDRNPVAKTHVKEPTMPLNTIPQNALIVVGTGEKALFFRNTGSRFDIALKAEGHLEPKDLDNDGPAGKQPPDTSAQESMEATFSKQLANHLYTMAHAGKFDHLVLVLDPDTMGEVRPSLHAEVQDRIVMELPKTLINNPVDDIVKSLTAATV